MSCPDHNDLDVNIQIRKIDRFGNPLDYANYTMPKPIDQVPSVNVAKYKGPTGILRASHRVSREPTYGGSGDYPIYNHETMEPIEPGTVVPLSIPIWPIGMVFDEGEGIMLEVAGHDLVYPETELLITDTVQDHNSGKHVVHTGGKYDSYLVIPRLN